MKDLDNLIIRLQKGIVKKSAYINTIRDPFLLIKALKELNELIGNNQIKESVAKQISYLILEKSREAKDDEIMLNTVLLGRPGCGKTEIGKKLAKIWYALGYLKGAQTAPKPKFNFDSFKPDNVEDQNMFNIFLFILLIWVVALTWNFYMSYGSLLTIILIITLIVVVAAIFYNSKTDVKNVKEKKDVNVPVIKTEQKVNDSDIITVVSRVNFVGGFIGSSALKTQKLLEDNLGKVLFIDEAYSLINSPDDPYGSESLNVLNLFMSEHPNEIIIIFAGYEDLLKNTIFKVQPGLKRRCMWQFECEGYDHKELYDIFKLKLDRKKWTIDDEENTKKLFKQHYDAFKEQGGSVDKIIFFSSLEHADEYLENQEIGLKNLKINHIQKGIERLIKNSVTDTIDESKTSNPYTDYMNMFKNKNNKKKEDVIENLTFEECENIKEVLMKC